MNTLPFDATHIAPKLYMGGQPPEGFALHEHGFKHLLLCAYEHQPPSGNFPGVKVISVPLDDSKRPPSPAELMRAAQGGYYAAKAANAGERVLVTCSQGRNRSGLVVALALQALTGESGSRCLERVRALREAKLGPGLVLVNPHFERVLRGIAAGKVHRAGAAR